MRNRITACAAVIGLALLAGCEPSPDELMAQAQEAIAAGEPRTAQIHLRNLLRQQPDAADVRMLLGEVSLAAGDAVGAEGDLRRALELGADPAAVQLSLLRALAAQGAFDEVLAQVAAGPALQGADQIMVLRISSAAYRAKGQVEEAEAALRSALALEPQSQETQAELAALLLDKGEIGEARAMIIAALRLQEDLAPFLVLRGRMEFLSLRYEDAERTFRQVVAAQGTRGAQYFAAASQLVETLLARAMLDEAAAIADELLRAYPEQPLAIALKATVEMEQGELDSARARVEALIANEPTYGLANRLLGTINALQGRDGQARMYLQGALTQNPTDRRAMLRLAALDLDQGDLDNAKRLLARVIEPAQASTDAVLFAMAARASLEAREQGLSAKFFAESARTMSGDVEELVAVSTVYAAAGELEQAQALLGDAAATDGPGGWTATYVLALIQMREGDFAAADASAARLVQQQPNLAWPWNFRGTVALMQRDLAAAREHYSAAVRIEPQFLPALLNRSRVEMLDGKPEQAVEDYRRILAVDPQQVDALFGMAQVALARGDVADAQRWLEQLPQSAARARLDGMLALAEGRVSDAAARFARAFEMEPSAEGALQAYATARQAGRANPDAPLLDWIAEHPLDTRVNMALGSQALEEQSYAAAATRFEAVVAVEPANVIALNNLAWIYQEQGDARALDFAQRAYQAAPDNPAVADTLGWLQVQGGDAAAALPLLARSHEQAPDSREIHYHWAVALARTGSRAEAAAELRALLADASPFAGREDAESLLRELE